MSGYEHDGGLDLDPRQQRARAAVRHLPPPTPRPEFLGRLREEFVTGSIPTPRRPAPRRAHRWRPALWAVPLATAAALVLLVVGLNRGPAWELRTVEGVEVVRVDGRPLPVDPPEPLVEALRAGARVEVAEGGLLELVSPGRMVLQLESEVALTLPPSPRRWFGRWLESDMQGRGRLRVTTGEAFAGNTYFVRTPFAEVMATGTTFTVIQGDGETCVCVLEGTVQACPTGGRMEPIGAGGRLTFLEEGRRVDRGEMLGTERLSLDYLRERAPGLLAGEANETVTSSPPEP